MTLTRLTYRGEPGHRPLGGHADIRGDRDGCGPCHACDQVSFGVLGMEAMGEHDAEQQHGQGRHPQQRARSDADTRHTQE
ncbi:hypothetical protein SAMN06272735_7847 [Streptomyces sp. TLI_55]|nr:hypothetical protein SAMN06272735_7847 [Streptomyces sp. TLI_55]